MTDVVHGHRVERVLEGLDVKYRCVECDLVGRLVVEFDRYVCDTRGDPPVSEPDVDPDPAPDRGL